MTGRAPLRLGYASAWWRPREATWSYTANRLRAALDLDARVAVVDIEAQRSLPVQVAAVAAARLRGRAWQLSGWNRRQAEQSVARRARRAGVAATLAVGETDPSADRPGWCYRDLDWLLALDLLDGPTAEWVNVPQGARPDDLAAIGERQAFAAKTATGVLAMSDWYRRWLVSRVGVDDIRVTVVGAGLNSAPTVRPPGPGQDRVLFVGVDFHRKGGDLVVAACQRLRSSGSRPVTLTVAGPPQWPLPGSPPEWVRYLGQLDSSSVADLYSHHDLFAMPSRFEAYGIALLEARAAGLPCVARDAMAMPELVHDGVSGRLVRDDDVDALATAIDGCLADAALLERVTADAPAVRDRHDWASVGRTITDRILAG